MRKRDFTGASLVLTLAGFALARSAACAENPAEQLETPVVEVIGVTPLPGFGVPAAQVPANVQAVTGAEIMRQHPLNLPEFMSPRLSGVNVNDNQGNPFQPALTYRGFTASPLRRWLMNSGRLSGCCRMISAPVTAWTFAGTCAAGTPKPGRGVTPITSTTGVSSCSAGFSAQAAPRARANPASVRTSDAPVKSRFRIGLLFQARDVMREILDVLLGDGLGDARHAAGIVGARARLEGFELLDHVLRVLARDARNLVLPLHAAQVAHGAQHLVGLFLPARDARRVRPERERLRLLRGEVVREIEHVLARKLR